jgi:hypothetical protein
VTVRRNVLGWKVAVTVFAADIVTVQLLPLVVVQPAGSLQSSPAPLILPVAP